MEPSRACVVLVAAALLDLTLAEPPGALHPVVWMGHAIAPLKRMRPRSKSVELAVGTFYVLAVTLGFAAGSWLLLRAVADHPFLATVLEIFLLFSSFACKGLVTAGARMQKALEAADLAAARGALSWLCSRDPAALSGSELAGATIESLTENTSDSVVAPLLYYALLGVPGALFYRAANTLDAMVGYRGRYEYLGKAAARLDDLLNLVPARLTALLLMVAGALLRLSVRAGLTVWWRDGGKTDSPNAGRPMAMAAGLLSVRLDKRGCYVLGAELPMPDAASIARTLGLVRLTALLALLSCAAGLMLWGAR